MLDINMEFKQGILIARLNGVLNGDTVELFKSDLDMVVKNNGIKYVLLNLNKLSFVDDYGLNAIKRMYTEIVSNKGKLILCGIDKLLNSSKALTENLYQVSDEVTAYEIVNI